MSDLPIPYIPPGGPTKRYQALMQAATDMERGIVTVNCPYCLVYDKLPNPVDVTRFVEHGGHREHVTRCSKGHKLSFRSVDDWREERVRAGVQTP